MKKIYIVFLAFCILFSLTACKKKETNTDEKKSTDIEDIVEDNTATKQGDLEFSDINIDSMGTINTVTATVKNTGKKDLTFKAVLYMKNSDNQTLGKVDQQINNLSSGDKTKIEVQIMGDYTTVSTFEVVVEDIVES